MEESSFEENEDNKNRYILGGLLLACVVLAAAFAFRETAPPDEGERARAAQVLPYESAEGKVLPFHSIGPSGYPKATFGVGCFWSGEQEFEDIPGVVSASVGYVGGDGKATPTYEEVKANTEQYVEVVTLEYDPEVTDYGELLKSFWRMHDPTPTKYTGTQYRSAVFFHSPEQKEAALRAKQELRDSGLYGDFEIVTEIDPGTVFHLAEDYHQNYYAKNKRKTFLGGH